MPNYLHNVLCITPKMTSNNTPSPVVISASSEYNSAWAAWGAFTQSGSDRSWSASGSLPQWIKVNLGEGNKRKIFGYTVVGRYDNLLNYNASAWTLQGSNDNSSWITLDTQTGQSLGNSPNMLEYALSSVSSPYQYFMFTVTACNSNGNPCFGEIELLGAPINTVHLPFRGRERSLFRSRNRLVL